VQIKGSKYTIFGTHHVHGHQNPPQVCRELRWGQIQCTQFFGQDPEQANRGRPLTYEQSNTPHQNLPLPIGQSQSQPQP